MIRSDSATDGSSSCWGENHVCIRSNACVHAARTEHTLGIEAVLDTLYQGSERRSERLEHLDGGAHGRVRTHQRGVTAVVCDRSAHDLRAGIVRWYKPHPHEAAGPI